MAKAKSNGIIRRPLEYFLIVVLIVLVLFLLWAVSVVREDNQNNKLATEQKETALVGSVREIDQLTENEIETEESIDAAVDRQEENAASADGAADNIGVAYDEDDF